MHFEQGHDHPRAVKYLLQAAENAQASLRASRGGSAGTTGLAALVGTLPPGAERDEQELGLRLILGVAVMAIRGLRGRRGEGHPPPARLELWDAYRSVVAGVHGAMAARLFHYFRAEMQPLRDIVAQLADRAIGWPRIAHGDRSPPGVGRHARRARPVRGGAGASRHRRRALRSRATSGARVRSPAGIPRS